MLRSYSQNINTSFKAASQPAGWLYTTSVPRQVRHFVLFQLLLRDDQMSATLRSALGSLTRLPLLSSTSGYAMLSATATIARSLRSHRTTCSPLHT